MTGPSALRRNIRRLRVFLAVVETGSVTRAAEASHVSQPAVTQSVMTLEALAGDRLFLRTPHGLFPTSSGQVLARRVRRALSCLDPALSDVSPRLRLTATASQLLALIAVRETENFTLAARRLGVAQPTVQRAVAQLERESGRPLFERTPHGIVASRPAQAIAQAARLAFAELDQAEADLAEATAREAGRIVIGAMPLSRSSVLPKAIARFRLERPTLPVQLLDGSYDDLLAGLRRGEIDFLIGALRDPAPIGDVEQRELFSDSIVFVCGRTHRLAGRETVTLEEMAEFPWVVGRRDAPIRRHFEALFSGAGLPPPASVVESGSVILMRELLDISDHLGCSSHRQAEAEIRRGLMRALPIDLSHTARPIGLTVRKDWLPTAAQARFIELLA